MFIDTDALGLMAWVALVAAGRVKSASVVARLLGIEPGPDTVVGKPRRRWKAVGIPPAFVRPAPAYSVPASVAPYRISRIRSLAG
jgi:hypothetical protein